MRPRRVGLRPVTRVVPQGRPASEGDDETDIIIAGRQVPFVQVGMIVHPDDCLNCERDGSPLCSALVCDIHDDDETARFGMMATLLFRNGERREEPCDELRRRWRLASRFRSGQSLHLAMGKPSRVGRSGPWRKSMRTHEFVQSNECEEERPRERRTDQRGPRSAASGRSSATTVASGATPSSTPSPTTKRSSNRSPVRLVLTAVRPPQDHPLRDRPRSVGGLALPHSCEGEGDPRHPRPRSRRNH